MVLQKVRDKVKVEREEELASNVVTSDKIADDFYQSGVLATTMQPEAHTAIAGSVTRQIPFPTTFADSPVVTITPDYPLDKVSLSHVSPSAASVSAEGGSGNTAVNLHWTATYK